MSRTLSSLDKVALRRLAEDIDKASDSPKYNRRSCPIGMAIFPRGGTYAKNSENIDRAKNCIEKQNARNGTAAPRRRSRSESSFFENIRIKPDQTTINSFLTYAQSDKNINQLVTSAKILMCIKNKFFKK